MWYRKNTDQVAAEKFDDEFVLINFGRGTYFSLRHIAVDVWEQFETGASPEEVSRRVQERFGVSGDEVSQEIDRCIRALVDEELLCEADAAGPVPETWASESWAAPLVEVYSDLKDLIVLDPIHEVDDTIGWPRRPQHRQDP